MQEDIDLVIEIAEDAMKHSLDHLVQELKTVRTGKANPAMLSSVKVDYYGSATPLSQVANISVADGRTINIQPWEKSMIDPIERAIFEANLGVTPQNDGEIVRIMIPMLTEERRREYVKKAKALGEDAKVSIRSARHKAMDDIKAEVKNGYPEDAGKRLEDKVQNLTNSYGKKVDEMIDAKEADIMKV